MPLVTVVIPAFNAEGTLERAVRSALEQTERDLEVIVVDDASSDDTFAIASRLRDADCRVRVLRSDVNRGVAASRNRALDAARGEWVALLDADDTWGLERLERLLEAADGADVVSDDLLVVQPPEGRVQSLLAWVNLDVRGRHVLSLAEMVRYDLGLLMPIIRRSFLERHELRYDATLRLAEDFYFYFDLLSAGAAWVQLRDGYYVYSRAEKSLTSHTRAVYEQHVAASTALIARHGSSLDPHVATALTRLNRNLRATVVRTEVFALVRERRVRALVHLLRTQPGSAALGLAHAARGRCLGALRRARKGLPIPARPL
ncbi:MAG: glycosyltransferase family 2 protein [Acidimicrobiia bacterium]